MSIHKRGRIWYAYLRDPATGRQITRSLKTTSKREAQHKHAMLQIEIGKHGGDAIAGKITFSELVDKYLIWSKANKRSWERDTYSSKHLLARFGRMRLSEITPLMIEHYKAERSLKVTNSTINRELAFFRHAYNQASRWGLYVGRSPMRDVTMLEENPARLRYLSQNEWAKLYDESPEHLKTLFLTLVSTGLRLGEALNLTWDKVDFENGILHVADSKSKRPRDVPIPSALKAALAELRENSTCQEVFTYRDKALISVRSGFLGACKRAEIKNLRLHDMRHTFASWQAMAGTPILTLKELLGHKDIQQTMRYAHLSPSHLRAAAKAIDTIIPCE